METEVLLFDVDDKRFGVCTENVSEVVRAVKLSPLPHPASHCEGLLNLRGRVVPVLDLRHLFGLAEQEIRYTDHLIVVRAGDRLLTLRADRATDLVRVAPSDLQPADTLLDGGHFIQHIGKVGDHLVYLLDVQRLVTLPDATTKPGKSTEAEMSP